MPPFMSQLTFCAQCIVETDDATRAAIQLGVMSRISPATQVPTNMLAVTIVDSKALCVIHTQAVLAQ